MMRGHNTTTRSTALALVFLLTVCSLPLSAAGKAVNAPTVGSVNSVGNVQLRGVTLSNEGTIFSGDRLNVGPGSYARAIVGTGHKIEVDANSDVVVSREGDNTYLQMSRGNVSFRGNGKGSIHVRIGAYDIAASPDAVGNVSYVGSSAFGVRIKGGSAIVRDTQTRKSFVVQKGGEQIVSLATGSNTPTMAQLASAVPSAVPAPALPRRQASSGWNTGMWVGIVAAAAGGATLVTYFLAREDDEEGTSRTKALTNLAAISSTAAATSAAAAQTASVASQAQTAINASNISAAAKANLQSQVTTITSQANSAGQKIATLNAKITNLQNAIAAQEDGPTAAQQNELNALINELNSARADANNAIAGLNTLLSSAAAQGVTGLPPNPNLQPIPPANIASASLPV